MTHIFSGISPRPVLQRFRYNPSFEGCNNASAAEVTLADVRERLSDSLPCILTEECRIHELTCEMEGTTPVLGIKLVSTASLRLSEQQLILETAALYLKTNQMVSISKRSTHSRSKRFSFDDLTPEDVVNTGCPDGEIKDTASDSCIACNPGTYANTEADPQVCSQCALDSYSDASRSTICTTCSSGLGTLDTGSDSSADCICKLYFLLKVRNFWPWMFFFLVLLLIFNNQQSTMNELYFSVAVYFEHYSVFSRNTPQLQRSVPFPRWCSLPLPVLKAE